MLETDRMILRPPKKEDEYFFYHLNKDEEVMKYIRPTMNREQSNDYFQKACEISDDKMGYKIAIEKSSAEFVGWFMLKPFEEPDKIEFGFRLIRRFWNQGLATEGSQCIKDFAFNELKLEQLVAVAHPENSASENVLFKTGFEYKGLATHYNTSVKYFELNKYNLMG